MEDKFEQRVALGRNAVSEALKAGETIQCVYIANGTNEAEASQLLHAAFPYITVSADNSTAA